jgi:hypothetical protein
MPERSTVWLVPSISVITISLGLAGFREMPVMLLAGGVGGRRVGGGVARVAWKGSWEPGLGYAAGLGGARKVILGFPFLLQFTSCAPPKPAA